MKPFIVVADGMDATWFEKLSNHPSFEVHPQRKNTQEELKSLLPKIEGLVVRSSTNPNKEFLDKCPQLKYIIRAGEGTDNIDKTYANSKEIKVSNTPGANNNSAAEHAMALAMTVLRKTAVADQSMKSEKWEKPKFTGIELWKKKIGIIGMGRIGSILAKRLSGFEPEVFFFDPVVENSPLGKKLNTVDEICRECDVITLHVPLNQHTKNLINGERLSLMRPNTILINASRGGVVDENALYETLKAGKIRGAGLDVFAEEPLGTSPLRELDNIVLTPHLGASTEEAQTRVGEMSVHQLIQFFDHNELINEVKG